MEVSLVLRVLPSYIECHYCLPFLFSEDWLSHPSILSFPEGWHIHPSVALFPEGLALPPNCCFILCIGLASQLLTFTMDWQSHPNITSCNIPQVTHNPNTLLTCSKDPNNHTLETTMTIKLIGTE